VPKCHLGNRPPSHFPLLFRITAPPIVLRSERPQVRILLGAQRARCKIGWKKSARDCCKIRVLKELRSTAGSLKSSSSIGKDVKPFSAKSNGFSLRIYTNILCHGFLRPGRTICVIFCEGFHFFCPLCCKTIKPRPERWFRAGLVLVILCADPTK